MVSKFRVLAIVLIHSHPAHINTHLTPSTKWQEAHWRHSRQILQPAISQQGEIPATSSSAASKFSPHFPQGTCSITEQIRCNMARQSCTPRLWKSIPGHATLIAMAKTKLQTPVMEIHTRGMQLEHPNSKVHPTSKVANPGYGSITGACNLGSHPTKSAPAILRELP